MREARLANLVTATSEGLIATPLPLILAPEEGPYGTLYGHVARANPQWEAPASRGRDGVIHGAGRLYQPFLVRIEAGTWKSGSDLELRCRAGLRAARSAARRFRAVARGRRKTRQAHRHAVTDAPKTFIQAQPKGIVGLRLPIARLEGKRKVSQNRSAADRAGVAAGLASNSRHSDRAVAALIPG
jgi:transcriptional regulator